MKIIRHRINTTTELRSISPKYGLEVDIRSDKNKLILSHDPFSNGDLLEDWLKWYKHETIILNIKEEGLEEAILKLLKRYKIENYFFLDQSFPFLIKWANAKECRCAVRVSEFESVETALALSNKIDWVWVDCFTKFPLNYTDYKRLKSADFKLCLVSPELQGEDPFLKIPPLRNLLNQMEIEFDAVCTKNPHLWERIC